MRIIYRMLTDEESAAITKQTLRDGYGWVKPTVMLTPLCPFCGEPDHPRRTCGGETYVSNDTLAKTVILNLQKDEHAENSNQS